MNSQIFTKSRIISIALGIFFSLFFTCMISNGTYHMMPVILSFLGAVIIAACVTQAVADFDSVYEIINKPEPEDAKEYYDLAPFIFPTSFVLVFG